MGEYVFPVRPPCLRCGSRFVARIIWGHPVWNDDLEGELNRKEAILGTCFMTEKGEMWECNACGYRFGIQSAMPLIMHHKGKDVPDYLQAQNQAWLYPEKIKDSKILACYHCLRTFTQQDIAEWINDIQENPIPLCPYCRQDSVIGDAHGFPLTEELLVQMRDYCYSKERPC